MTGTIEPTEYVPSDALKEKLTADDVAMLGKFCDWLALWRQCGTPACRRARACTGDTTTCFGRFYTACPEHLLVWVDAGMTAMGEGYTARAATLLADAALLVSLKAKAGLPLVWHTVRRRTG